MQQSLIAALALACTPLARPQASDVRPQAPSAPPAADHVTLVFSGAVAGQLVPCGCSPDQKGGLPHAVALVDKLRAQEPNFLFVDAGDLLFENAQPPPRQLQTQRQMKARVLAEGDKLLHAAARAIGQRDLALGPQFLLDTADGVPLLDAGFAPVPGARATLLADAGAVKVGIFAAGFEPDVAQVIAARAKGLREQGARLVVLLLHPKGDNALVAAQGLLSTAQAAGVDLVVLGRRDDPATDDNRKDAGPPPLVAIEGHGQSLARVDVHFGQGPLTLAPSAEDVSEEIKGIQTRIDRFKAQIELYPSRKEQLGAKIKELEEKQRALKEQPAPKPAAGSAYMDVSFVPVTDKAGTDAQAQKLVDAYDAKVGEINLAEAKTQPAACPSAGRGELAYVGVNGCVECHQDQVDFWKQTRHAHAYETLVAVKKQFSLDCVRCHVTGWQQPGGVCRIDKTDVGGEGVPAIGSLGDTNYRAGVGRRDVQCEDCHGPGSEHVEDPTGHIRAEVAATVCMRCHEPANSPKFDYAKYKPFIVGPGHGEPLKPGQKPKPREGVPFE